jgi:hypothetical protein
MYHKRLIMLDFILAFRVSGKSGWRREINRNNDMPTFFPQSYPQAGRD